MQATLGSSERRIEIHGFCQYFLLCLRIWSQLWDKTDYILWITTGWGESDKNVWGLGKMSLWWETEEVEIVCARRRWIKREMVKGQNRTSSLEKDVQKRWEPPFSHSHNTEKGRLYILKLPYFNFTHKKYFVQKHVLPVDSLPLDAPKPRSQKNSKVTSVKRIFGARCFWQDNKVSWGFKLISNVL